MSAPSRAGSGAVSHAMSKLGAPYRWGATGPFAFDCSGLVSWAYKKVGVSLPRTSRAMSRVGTPVSKSALRPGDLVFFYTPVSHVGIYIGGGKVVNASQPGTPVKVSNVSGMPFNSARRV
jgi:cell wall-associated NlpC family hydrolase